MIAIGTADFPPKDERGDDKTAIIHIRASTGGLEGQRFASDLLHMYHKYAELQGWSVDLLLHVTEGPQNTKEAMIRVTGTGAYARLKNERGIHRVQRVPQDEQQGRIHTSTASVALYHVSESTEKIRTYNYPDDQARDHRAKRSVAGVHKILDGELDPLIDLFMDLE